MLAKSIAGVCVIFTLGQSVFNVAGRLRSAILRHSCTAI